MYRLLAHLADPAEWPAARLSPRLRVDRGGAAPPRTRAVALPPRGQEDEAGGGEFPGPRRLIVR